MKSIHLTDWLRNHVKAHELRWRCMSVWRIDESNLAYIAVPKAASSAIRNLIRDRQTALLFPNARHKSSRANRRTEKRIKYSTTPTRLGKIRDRYFFFSFVRNPLSRLYSCYRDKVVNAAQRRTHCSLRRHGIDFGISFDQFIDRVAVTPDSYADQHFRSQHTFLTDGDELVVDFLGRFERFTDDWMVIEQRFGLPRPGRNHRVSGPPTALHQLPVSRSGVERVLERYQRDVELFGYYDEIHQCLDALTTSVST